jgi:antitoxin component of MazEF toxin-antitoxin module
MESFTATARKVGNSVGVLIPKEVLERQRLSEGSEVRISIAPKMDESLFGRFKGRFSIDDLDAFVAENKDAWGN